MNTNMNTNRYACAPVHETLDATPNTQRPDEIVTDYQVPNTEPSISTTQLAWGNYDEPSTLSYQVQAPKESDERLHGIVQDTNASRMEKGQHNRHKDFETYSNLYVLDASFNQLSYLPEAIGDYKNLLNLDLRNNNLTFLPNAIGDLSKLERLEVSSNYNLNSLPLTLSKCTNLCSIGISDCNFTEFPNILLSMPQICKIGCNNNMIKVIPPKISNLKSLIKLDLTGNLITELPVSFCTLTKLTWLNLSNNRLTHLPDNFGNLRRLTELGLCDNTLTMLPDLSKMKQLRILNVHKNQLISLGEWIYNLDSLGYLQLSFNNLTELPSSLFSCPSLEFLVVCSNKLLALPELPASACRVSRIDFRDNQLRSIPSWCFNFLLVELRLSGNPWLLPHEYSPPKTFPKTLEQSIFTKLLRDPNTHPETYNNLPERIYRKLLEQLHTCDGCHKHFCGTPVNFVEFRTVTDDSAVPTVLKLCGAECIIKMQAK